MNARTRWESYVVESCNHCVPSRYSRRTRLGEAIDLARVPRCWLISANIVSIASSSSYARPSVERNFFVPTTDYTRCRRFRVEL